MYVSDAGKDHTDCDCFAMAVLSHGDDGQVFGTDGVMQIKKLVEPLKRCESLRGKPKLFIVQVCTSAGIIGNIQCEQKKISHYNIVHNFTKC